MKKLILSLVLLCGLAVVAYAMRPKPAIWTGDTVGYGEDMVEIGLRGDGTVVWRRLDKQQRQILRDLNTP